MLSFDEAAAVLDAACEALPKELFEGLNGGVSLQKGTHWSEDGRLVMGLYHRDMLGKWIEIFYGSLRRNFGDDEERFREELVKVLKHELTHHIEYRAGERGLELEDERQTEAYRAAREDALFNGGKKPSGTHRLRRRSTPQRPWEDEP